MKVRELIEKLRAMDSELEVARFDSELGEQIVDEVRISDEVPTFVTEYDGYIRLLGYVRAVVLA